MDSWGSGDKFWSKFPIPNFQCLMTTEMMQRVKNNIYCLEPMVCVCSCRTILEFFRAVKISGVHGFEQFSWFLNNLDCAY